MPADPVVSPADTIRLAGEYIATAVDGGPSDFEWLIRVFDAAHALLAVGERDKAEIAELRDRLEVVSGNVYLWQIGELSARDTLNAIVADSATRRTAQISERERDRQHIAQLTAAVKLVNESVDADFEFPRGVA